MSSYNTLKTSQILLYDLSCWFSLSFRMTQNTSIPVSYPMMPPMDDLNKYAHLLQVIEEMGRDIKPTYANNKNAAERLKKNIHTARILVRECVSELERVMKA